MRRMLDPKEAGGDVKLYCHRIKLTSTPNNMITLNYFSTSDVPFTRSAFTAKLVNHHLPCSGAISSTGGGTKVKYIPTYFYFNDGKTISCSVIDLDTNTSRQFNLDTFNFYDDVVPA